MYNVYDVTKSTQYNRENGPFFSEEIPTRSEKPPMPVKLWDFQLNSPLGVPAGPLFNSKFIKLYAEMGFDTVVYKTVRSVARIAHQNPNIVFANTDQQITEDRLGGDILTRPMPSNMEELTITNSFGVNSLTIPEWQEDFAKAQSYLKDGQLLILSVTGTPGLPDREMDDDFAYTCAAGKDAGAKAIVINYSCPNVKEGGEGSIYTDPDYSSQISKKVKKAIGNTPLIIKLGYYKDPAKLAEVVAANAPYVDGIAAINTIKMNVRNPDGNQALPGPGRLGSGLCGAALLPFSTKTIAQIATEKKKHNYDFEIIGTGGVVLPQHFDELLNAGAKIAMSGAGAMWDPYLANKWEKLKIQG